MKGTGWQWVSARGRRLRRQQGRSRATVSVEPRSSGPRERCAGGWDIDRKFRDFGDAQFWTEFYAAQTESYLELSDAGRGGGAGRPRSTSPTPATYPTHYTLPAGYPPLGWSVAQADVLQAAALAPRSSRTPRGCARARTTS
jgi:hypothetical protein